MIGVTYIVLVDDLSGVLVDIEGVEHDGYRLADGIELGGAARKLSGDLELVDVSIEVEVSIAGETIHGQTLVLRHDG
jgi:hypothetical protein